MTKKLRNIDDIKNPAGKRILLRADLNVPMEGGRIIDLTRIERVIPTIKSLVKKRAKVIIISHLGRPEGYNTSLSLAPLVDKVSDMLGQKVAFGVDSIGAEAEKSVKEVKNGGVILLENLRFHQEEQNNNPKFAAKLARLGDIYVNDAFSSSHRKHASIVGVASLLPAYAGFALQKEMKMLAENFEQAKRPLLAIIGGVKISTKLKLLKNIVKKVDNIIISGAMANIFLHAQNKPIGKSVCETGMENIALDIIKIAEKNNCRVLLPIDFTVAEQFKAGVDCRIVSDNNIKKNEMILDIGPESLRIFHSAIEDCRTILWNGPCGAFELSPFENGTVGLARIVASLTDNGKIRSLAGGGDTLAALRYAGVGKRFTYLSTGGGAFLHWMEGKEMPGIKFLMETK